jgi:exonuclease III
MFYKRKNLNAVLSILLSICWVSQISGQSIVLDEAYDDWSKPHIISHTDPKTDGSATDILDVRLSNDEKYLYIYVSTSSVFNIQSNNDLTMYIDIDNNASTGILKNSIGADLVYTFGDRSGRFYQGSTSYKTWHNDIDLVTSPTVTSDRFEMRIARKFLAENRSFTMAPTIKVVIADDKSGGDTAPNNGAYSITFDDNLKSLIKPISLSKQSSSDIRYVSYNVLKDNLFDPSLTANYKRVINAIKPDIIGFCEIYDRDGKTTGALIESFLPSSGSQKWYTDEASPDIRIVSRYPITERISLDGNGVFVLNVNGKTMLYIMTHLPCCDNETGRQQEVDKIMKFVRDVRYGISSLNIPQNTPIIISGDMNLVGFRDQQQTFVTGNISNNTQFGPDFRPDWDESDLEDAKPLTTNQACTSTWYNDFGSYSAGRLDYFFYSGSVIKLKNNYALLTYNWSNAQLSAAGLQAYDVEKASDHAPVVADFSFDLSTSTHDVAKIDLLAHINNDILYVHTQSAEQISHCELFNIMGQSLPLSIEYLDDHIVVNLATLQTSQVYFLKCMVNSQVSTLRFVK